MEFHILRSERDRYTLDQNLYRLDTGIIHADFAAFQSIFRSINQKKQLENELIFSFGELYAIGLLDEILHLAIQHYQTNIYPSFDLDSLQNLNQKIGQNAVNACLSLFVEEFPPEPVFFNKQTPALWLDNSSNNQSNRSRTLEDLITLWVLNQNPAANPYQELFDDNHLSQTSQYPQLLAELSSFSSSLPIDLQSGQSLIELLLAPIKASPASLMGQLEYIRIHWGSWLGSIIDRLLIGLDLLKEENKKSGFGPGPFEMPVFDRDELTDEVNFSQDLVWMENLILLSKNVYVWLGQLSHKYQRNMTHLDQIPDEELDSLSRQGITGLWLIGLWERSRASARIKQLCGNPDAIASAYSLAGYQIASDLGGTEALTNLRDRASQRGIRLASDMVPNHCGIDSEWVCQHPDWFLQLDHSPYPSYTFDGPDLSSTQGIGIFIEDHYYSRSDAAVVFKWVNYLNGEVRYIYHGNDGTAMPWNDTAQLNYLNPQVREAVIQTILNVARQFPIIRFDAAMTLTRQHYQRLWFPEPGKGGDIPTRAGRGVSRDEFEKQMPEEFWHEVVERITNEVPGTLLLAEAFWLMENYFVRSLGMHRVYNSAFMNLLRDEDNAHYRGILKKILEFEPQILKRFVNFMNNPDERTAVEQFGKGDKYFGICTLLVTLPGLPMLGHGQIEGYSEKYGMEFRRALWDEKPDTALLDRHARQIFPLMRQRALFAGIEGFRLFDLIGVDGQIIEDVYAYTNVGPDQRHSLVVYHNRFANVDGWIKSSSRMAAPSTSENQPLHISTISKSLDLPTDPEVYLISSDAATGLEHIFSCLDITKHGLHLNLQAYQTHVFTDFRFVQDDEKRSYRNLWLRLGGRGVSSIEEAVQELRFAPLLDSIRALLNPKLLQSLQRLLFQPNPTPKEVTEIVHQVTSEKVKLINAVYSTIPNPAPADSIYVRAKQSVNVLFQLFHLQEESPFFSGTRFTNAARWVEENLRNEDQLSYLLIVNSLLSHIAEETSPESFSAIFPWLEDRLLKQVLDQSLEPLGISNLNSQEMMKILGLTHLIAGYFKSGDLVGNLVISRILMDPQIQNFIGITNMDTGSYFDPEGFEQFLWWLFVVLLGENFLSHEKSSAVRVEGMMKFFDYVLFIGSVAEAKKYHIATTIQALSR